MSPVRATALQLSLDLQLRTLQLSRYARSKRSTSAGQSAGHGSGTVDLIKWEWHGSCFLVMILYYTRHIEAAGMMSSCAVCVEPLKVGQRVSRWTCGHMFHARCLHTWLRQADSCPNCRLTLRRQDRGGGGAADS